MKTKRDQVPVYACRPAAALIFLAVLLSASAYGQGNGVLEGRVVNGTDPSLPTAKMNVEAVSPAAGMSVLKTVATDSSGKFRIDGLPTDQPLMIRTSYKSVPYHGVAAFDSAGKAKMDLKVFEPTESLGGIRAEAVRLAFQLSGDHLDSLETVSLENRTAPPRTINNPDGVFRFGKAPGIAEPPRIDVIGPGSSVPLTQSALESADGKHYYTLYPLRPGVTAFEVQQTLPYTGGTYTYRKTFYQDVESYEVGVIPADMALSGQGLKKIRTDAQRNFAVYSGGAVKAGTEVVWTFTGGTPIAAQPAQGDPMGGAEQGKSGGVVNMPNSVGANVLAIAPLLLAGFLMVLWFAHNRMQADSQPSEASAGDLKRRRDQLIRFLADIDDRNESQTIDRREYVRQREGGKRQLRRIAMLLKNKGKSVTRADSPR